MPDLRAGVIGTGGIGTQHNSALRSLGVEVTACYGTNPSKVATFAAAFGARIFDDPSTMVSPEHIDVLFIAVPPYAHDGSVELMAAQAAIPFLVEKPIGHRVYGSWRHTEYTVMPGAQAGQQALPSGLTWEDGVDIAQMGPICVNAVAFAEGEHRGSPVVVFGAGPVGLITAQIAKADGATAVYVVDRLASRLAIAEGLGLEPIEAAPGVDVAVTLKTRLGAEGIPVAFEATGASAALHEAIRVVRRRGLVVALGFYLGDAVSLRLGDEFHHNGVRITCGQIGNIHPAWTWDTLRARTRDLAVAGDLVLGGLSRLTLSVDEVADGFAALSRPAEVLQVALDYAAR